MQQFRRVLLLHEVGGRGARVVPAAVLIPRRLHDVTALRRRRGDLVGQLEIVKVRLFGAGFDVVLFVIDGLQFAGYVFARIIRLEVGSVAL